MGYPLLFDTSLSSPSFTSVLFRQVLFGELLITSFLVALFFSFHLPSVVSTHSSFWITGKEVEKAERERLPFRLLFVGDSREVKCWLDALFPIACCSGYFSVCRACVDIFSAFASVCLLALLLVLEIFLGRSCLSFISSIAFASAFLTCLVPIIS